MPSWLGPDAKREWKRVVGELTKAGMLTNLDRTALAAYCEAFQDWVNAIRIVRKEGLTFVRANGSIGQHPAVVIRDKAWLRVCKGAAAFGNGPIVAKPDQRGRSG